MKVRDLYKMYTCAIYLEAKKEIKKGMCFFSVGVQRHFQEYTERLIGLYNLIYSHDNNTSFYIEGESCNPDLNPRNEKMLNEEVPEGYWIYTHDAFDIMEFHWYPNLKEANKAYRKIKVSSIKHISSYNLYKFLFLINKGKYKLLKYEVESRFSELITPTIGSIRNSEKGMAISDWLDCQKYKIREFLGLNKERK